MPVETDADRLEMIEDFGVTVRIGGSEYLGIFDAPFTAPVGVAGQARELLMRSSDVTASSLADGGAVTVTDEDGTETTYTARTPQPDGTGMTVVPLHPQ